MAASFNQDLPYNEFARLQIAGDALKPDDPNAVEATGFLVAGAYDSVGQNQLSETMKAVVKADEMEDYVAAVGQTFLGLTINCARCHDHKFDPIRQVEYYRFASSLAGVRHGERDLSKIDPDLIGLGRRIESLARTIKDVEAPARARILECRKQSPDPLPTPTAAWDFKQGLDDQIGSLDAELKEGALIGSDGLKVDGETGYAETPPLPFDLSAKTIEAWVKLANLDQRGGAVLSLQTPDGGRFDAIVFGEQEPGRWMAGSEGFVRTTGVQGPPETEASRLETHIAITYAQDGDIRIFRDGRPYGKSYRAHGLASFPKGSSQVVFGLRHKPIGGNRMLAGTIVRARIYDRALDPSEVAASAGASSDYVSREAVLEALSVDQREELVRLNDELGRLRAALASSARKAYVVCPQPSAATRVQIRGNPGQLGDIVSPGGIGSLAGLNADFGLSPDAPESERRVELANWIASAKNPLFARVLVNRLWQAHFGSGLVETSSDLGFSGGSPSHPELLDWLASELVSRGWSIKAMHRLIVTSATYRQRSKLNAHAMKRDAGDRLLWRKSPSRLEAEMVRDAMLEISGKLDRKLGGPSFFDQTVTKAPGTAALLYVDADPAKPGLDRRTLYRAWVRGGRSGLLSAFDCPDPSTTAPKRANTTTPLQALALLNNALVLHLSEALADRLAREEGADPVRQVDRAYRLALGRRPQSRGTRTSRLAGSKVRSRGPCPRPLQ